jgi:arylformamidase
MFLHKSGGQRPIVFGHSAGGHLAACLLATEWQSLGAPADLVPAAMGLSGLYDLTPMIRTAMNADFRLDDAEARRMSPLFQPAPGGKTFDAIVGGSESSEFLRQSREVAEVWGKAGVTTRFEALTGVNHFTILDPLTDPNSAMVKRLLELCGVS